MLSRKSPKNRGKASPTRRPSWVRSGKGRNTKGPKWPDQDGLFVGVWVLESLGGRRRILRGEFHVERTIHDSKQRKTAGPASRGIKRAPGSGELSLVAETLAALGSMHRLRIINLLLLGTASYRALVKATGLLAGPMYHHLRHLELAGLLESKQRNEYALTRRGKRIGAVARALGQVLK